MAAKIKGVNTGVIRNGDAFIALALKVKKENNATSLFFIPALVLRDIFISLEYRLDRIQRRSAKEQQAFAVRQAEATRRMSENVPPLLKEELEQGDVGQRVAEVIPNLGRKGEIGLGLQMESGKSADLLLDEAQISLFITAVSRAIQNAGMHALSLRLSSLLDFLPLYDADFQPNDSLQYDTYAHPAWKLALFDRTQVMVYHYTDDEGREQCCGTVVKSRTRDDDGRLEAIARRLITFSPRLKRLEEKNCRVSIRSLTTGEGGLALDDYLKALYILRQEAAEQARSESASEAVRGASR